MQHATREFGDTLPTNSFFPTKSLFWLALRSLSDPFRVRHVDQGVSTFVTGTPKLHWHICKYCCGSEKGKSNLMAEFLKISDFQDRFNVSRSTVYRLQNRGEIEFVRIGRTVRIPRISAEQWFETLVRNQANDG